MEEANDRRKAKEEKQKKRNKRRKTKEQKQTEEETISRMGGCAILGGQSELEATN